MALVAAGGAFGALARVGVADAVRDLAALPLATLLVNLAGAFALGVLVGRLDRTSTTGGVPPSGEGPPSGEVPRALVGVGFLGALTTFSTFAVQLAVLPAAAAVAYAALTVAGGLALAAAGLRWGASS